MAVENRRYCQEMSKSNQDLVFLSYLHFGRQDKRLEKIYTGQVRKRYGERVEADTFMEI